MMREADKPFVLYRRGPWNFNIVPRGRRGWMLTGLWVAGLLIPAAAFEHYVGMHAGRSEFFVGLALLLAATLVWAIAMTRWMKARAEVIDLRTINAPGREKNRRGGRGRGQGRG